MGYGGGAELACRRLGGGHAMEIVPGQCANETVEPGWHGTVLRYRLREMGGRYSRDALAERWPSAAAHDQHPSRRKEVT